LWVLEQPRVDNSSVGPLKRDTLLGAYWLKAGSAGIDTSIKRCGVKVVLLD